MGRRQKSVLNRTCASKWSNVKNGVPQGSVLGPVLFNIYVYDMPHNVDSVLLYSLLMMLRCLGQLNLSRIFSVYNVKLWQLNFNVK